MSLENVAAFAQTRNLVAPKIEVIKRSGVATSAENSWIFWEASVPIVDFLITAHYR